MNDDLIRRSDVLEYELELEYCEPGEEPGIKRMLKYVRAIPAVDAVETDKYEYHYDHTDCLWYRTDERVDCPVTCAAYRDGWNDAMRYIFKDGKGYNPYFRGEHRKDGDDGAAD